MATRRFVAKIGCFLVLCGVSVTAGLSPDAGRVVHAAPPPQATWLEIVNWYRTASRLPPVVEEPTWTAGIQAHLRYLELTPVEFRVGEYASAHRENPASPYYTADGAAAAGASNLASGRTDREAIENWIVAPFHAINIFQRGLTKVAFARDSTSHLAGLDVLRGVQDVVEPTSPVVFPGDGSVIDLKTYKGGEHPSPIETCGYQAPTGLAMFALLSASPSPFLIAEVTGPKGTIASSGTELCVVSEHTYRSTDAVYGPTGLGILQGSKAVLVIPREPLIGGEYRVVLRQPGATDVSWGFSIPRPPPPPAAVAGGSAVKIHATDTPNAMVFGNLTVVDAAGGGFTTAYPCASGRTNTSNSNFVVGQTVANFVSVRADANGDVCFFTSATAHLLWDQVGQSIDALAKPPPPERRLDTRTRGSKQLAGDRVRIRVSDTPHSVVAGNLTVVDADDAGFATVFPCDQPQPGTSNSNFVAGQTVATFVAVATDAIGDLCVVASASVHLVWDSFGPLHNVPASAPTRVVDTRRGSRLLAGTTLIFGRSVPGQSVMGTLTVVNPSEAGYVSAFPCDGRQSEASTVNFVAGQTVANFAMVTTDDRGRLCVFTTADTDLVWDQAAQSEKLRIDSPIRKLDSRRASTPAQG